MDDDDWALRAAAALEAEVRSCGPTDRLRELLRHDQAVGSDEEAQQRRLAIQSEALARVHAIDSEFRAHTRGGPVEVLPAFGTRTAFDDVTFAPRSSQWPYTLQWTYVTPPVAPSDSYVSTDVDTGIFDVYRGNTPSTRAENGHAEAYAGIGVWFTPTVASCELSIRPYVVWKGWDLIGREFGAKGPAEPLLAGTEAYEGIVVQSTDLRGGDFRTDLQVWPRLWSEGSYWYVNRQFWHSGTNWAPDFWVRMPASNTRRYAIWVIARAVAWGALGEYARAYSAMSLNFYMQSLMVGQVY